jgi:hypothetical protein
MDASHYAALLAGLVNPLPLKTGAHGAAVLLTATQLSDYVSKRLKKAVELLLDASKNRAFGSFLPPAVLKKAL